MCTISRGPAAMSCGSLAGSTTWSRTANPCRVHATGFARRRSPAARCALPSLLDDAYSLTAVWRGQCHDDLSGRRPFLDFQRFTPEVSSGLENRANFVALRKTGEGQGVVSPLGQRQGEPPVGVRSRGNSTLDVHADLSRRPASPFNNDTARNACDCRKADFHTDG